MTKEKVAMSTLVIITPSFGPDFELCAALNASVIEHSPQSVRHDIIVPRGDMELFRRLDGPRTRIHDEAEFLPRSFRPLPGLNFSVNLRRPIPPATRVDSPASRQARGRGPGGCRRGPHS